MIKQKMFKKVLSPIVMVRLTVWLCLFLISFNAYSSPLAYAQETKISLKIQNKPLAEVLDAIKAQSEFSFVVNTSEVDLTRIVNVDMRKKTVMNILTEVLRGTDVTYEIDGKHIFLFKKKETERVDETILLPSAQFRITGTVTDDTGEPMPGVNVIEKGTSNGTVTNIDGKYQVSVSGEDAVLQFSFIGYSAREMLVGTQTVINVTLLESAQELEEIVVVGYGVQKKESIVASIVQTTNEELAKSGNVSDLKQALTGRLPGVTTVVSSGEPGGVSSGESATAIYIRGRNTWNGGQPLILVDGVERNMDNVDYNEVESISTLKDASATAVFGVKGANGVIIINTKRGSSASKPQLSFSYEGTALSVSKLPQKMDSYDAIMTRNEMIERELELSPTSWTDYVPYEIALRYRYRRDANDAIVYPNVDWEKALFKDVSWSHRANLNITGGTNSVKYFGSLSYLHEGDMFKDYDNEKGYDPNYNFDRFNFRSNIDFSLTKTTIVKVNLAGFYSQKNTNYVYANANAGHNPMLWAAAYRFAPDVMLPQYPDGAWGQSGTLPPEQLQNPVALVYNTGIWERKTTELNLDFELEQKLDFITKGLQISGRISYDNSMQTVGGLYDNSNAVRIESTHLRGKQVFANMYTGPDQDPSEYTQDLPNLASTAYDWVVPPWNLQSEAVSSTYRDFVPVWRRMVYQVQLNYNRYFGLHNVGATGVFKREQYSRGDMFPSYREDWVVRTTYDYDSRYLFEFNGAYNGSEKFGVGYRFDFFPSLGVGWYISNENFIKNNISWLNRLKVRYSIGMVGDDTGTGTRWLYMSQYASGSYRPRLGANPNNQSPYTIYRESVIGNPDINWEKARKDNYGLEIGVLNNMLSLTYDYFTENRTDIMIAGNDRAVPPYFGGTPPAANLGQVKSKGHEIELKFDKRTSFGLDYWASFAFTHIRNKIINRDDPALRPDYMKQAGYPIQQLRTQVAAGFYQNWDEVYASVPQEVNDLEKIPGYYNILDFNGDGKITENGDNIPYGFSEIPENTYSLFLGTSYKGFSFMIQFYGVNNVSRNVPLDNFYLNQNTIFEHVYDYWSKDNPNASSFLPRWNSQGQFIGNYYIYDGSYIRLKTAEIAYEFQDKILQKIGLSKLRVFVNGNNLAFWSDLPDDREAAWSGGAAAQGAYPTPRRINFGFNVTF